MAEQSEREWVESLGTEPLGIKRSKVIKRLESKATANRELMDMNARLVARIRELEEELQCLKPDQSK